MGCDIHIYTEKNLDGDGWTSADFYTKRKYADGEIMMGIVEVYDGRNYDLFSLLANVRNRGYIKPICEPRGLPDDCCAEIKEEFSGWGDDGHSTSWFTLKELIEAFEQNKESGGLEEIIKNTTDRLKHFSYSWEENTDKIRIVFWFDN